MVCHPIPPPLPMPFIIRYAMVRISMNLGRCGRLTLSHGHIRIPSIRLRGFTAADNFMLCIIKRPFGTIGCIIRSQEEGWIVIDWLRSRWKRLGWLDNCVTPTDDSGRIPYSKYIVAVEDQIVNLLDRGEDWVWGEDGWRYDYGLKAMEQIALQVESPRWEALGWGVRGIEFDNDD